MFVLALCRWYNGVKSEEKQQEQQRQQQQQLLKNRMTEKEESLDQRSAFLRKTGMMTKADAEKEEFLNENFEFFLGSATMTLADKEKKDFPEQKSEFFHGKGNTIPVAIPRPHSLSVEGAVGNSSCLISSSFSKSEKNSADDEFLSNYTTPYESIHESEKLTYLDEEEERKKLLHGILGQKARILEKTTQIGSVRQPNMESTNQDVRKEKLIAKIAGFMDTLDAATQNSADNGTIIHKIIEGKLDEGEFYLHEEIVPSPSTSSVPQSSSLLRFPEPSSSSVPESPLSPVPESPSSLVPEPSPSFHVLRSSSPSVAPKSSSHHSSPKLLPPLSSPAHRHPFFIPDNACNFSDSYSGSGKELHSHSSVYLDPNVVASSCTKVPPLSFFLGKRQLSNGSAAEGFKNVLGTGQRSKVDVEMLSQRSQAGFELRSRRSNVNMLHRNQALGADVEMNNGEVFPTSFPSESSSCDAESSVHPDSESATSDFEPYISSHRNTSPEKRPFNQAPEFEERIYDLTVPENNGCSEFEEELSANSAIPVEMFLSCYDTFQNEGVDGWKLFMPRCVSISCFVLFLKSAVSKNLHVCAGRKDGRLSLLALSKEGYFDGEVHLYRYPNLFIVLQPVSLFFKRSISKSFENGAEPDGPQSQGFFFFFFEQP